MLTLERRNPRHLGVWSGGLSVSGSLCGLLQLVSEPLPCVRSERQRSTLTVRGVAHQDTGIGNASLNAVAAVAAVTGLAPRAVVYVVHRSSAAFTIRSREATFGSASLLRASKSSAMSDTTGASSATCPPEASSKNTILCVDGRSARMNAPGNPLCPPAAYGTTCMVTFGNRDMATRWSS